MLLILFTNIFPQKLCKNMETKHYQGAIVPTCQKGRPGWRCQRERVAGVEKTLGSGSEMIRNEAEVQWVR